MEKIGKSLQESIRILRSAGVETERKSNSYKFGTVEECRKALTYYFMALDKTNTEFEWLPEYDDIADWMSDTKGKGLLLIGDCGRGKSTILLSVMPMIFFRKFNKVIHPISAKEINMPDPKRGKSTKGWEEAIKQWCFALDELGTEERETNYLEPFEPFNKVIDDAEKFVKLMLINTNLTKEQLLERYGERCYDRLIRLCRMVEFKGKSYRK